MADWAAESRPVPAELTPGFAGETYPRPPTKFATWAEQLDNATHEQLRAMAKAVL